jgi:glutaredoxin
MIGYDFIGRNGRLGNQMFQYAALKGISVNRNFEYSIPPQDYSNIQIDNYGLLECFRLSTNKNIGYVNHRNVIQESGFDFDEKLFQECPDNCNLSGYFQTEKYFKHIEDDIRKDFQFKDNWIEPCISFMEDFSNQEVVFLHVRRGDPNLTDRRGFKWAYVNLQDHHPVQTLDYYIEALSYFPSDMPVLVFSDSIDWCKEQDIFKGDRFMFSEQNEKFSDGALVPYLDLCLMSLCSHAIIANSSMSWWGAWLIKNQNKKVIAPKKWFGSAYANHNTKDLYCSDWRIL